MGEPINQGYMGQVDFPLPDGDRIVIVTEWCPHSEMQVAYITRCRNHPDGLGTIMVDQVSGCGMEYVAQNLKEMMQ